MDVVIFNVRKRDAVYADVLPFLTNSATSITGVELYYIGDNELARSITDFRYPTNPTPRKNNLNRKIAKKFNKLTGIVDDFINISFIGVPVTYEKDYSTGEFENTIAFKYDTDTFKNLVGNYFLMSLTIEGKYESREMQVLDGIMKHSKYYGNKEDREFKNHYASFLMRLERVTNKKLVFTNFGVVIENSSMIYRAGEVFTKAFETPQLEGSKPKNILDQNPSAGCVVLNDGRIISRIVSMNAFQVPFYFRDSHLKMPKNRRISYTITPYKIDKDFTVIPFPPFRATSITASTLRLYDLKSYPANVRNIEVIGYIERNYYLGFSDKLMPTANAGNWGFYLTSDEETVTIYELPAEEVMIFLSKYKVNEEKVDTLYKDSLLLFDNYIEKKRREIRELVKEIDKNRWEHINNVEGGK